MKANTNIHFYILFVCFVSVFSSCKKQSTSSVAICLSQHKNEVDLQIQYSSNVSTERSNVYRSSDNKTFDFIGEVNRNNIIENTIVYRDTSITTTGSYYYKVSSGTSLSEVQSIGFTPNYQLFQIFPNPVADTLTISSNYHCGAYSVDIHNRWGSVVFSENHIVENEHKINVSMLAPETYVVVISFLNRSYPMVIIKR